ncbi:uncharacterized protein LOC117594877 isoform X5 [Esox lucius]|uniref:uncharacterized protein LOC117594877 isoform X5 n=1 Tax=Esox lucius TaxID=8010 RepID=UPI001476FC6E|nr:uncharacterized protein LOC117594877 isoform X5 [Esox lucius]
MVLKTAYSLLVVFLWSVTATTAKDCGQIIQVVVSPIVSKKGENVTLTCVTNCTLTNATYIWYRNGQRLDEPTSRQLSVISYYTSSFSCSVKDHEDLQSPTMCVLGRKCFNVTYTRQSICALEGSVMDLPCKYQYPNHHTLSWTSWYVQERGDERPVILSSLPEYSGRVKYLGDNMSECTLRITDLRETDSAEYKFRFKTQNAEWGYSFPGTTLTVTDLQVKVTPGKPKTKTLTCSTSCNLTDNSNLTYVWYKNGQRLDELVSHQHSVKEYHTDSFSCSLLNLRSAVVCVVGQSCMNVSYTHQSVCALKGSTVNISCTFSHLNSKNVTEKTWFNKWDSGIIKDLNQDPEYAGRVEYHRTTDKDSTLTVTDLRESDSAEYKFRFTSNKVTWGYSFPGTTLTVTDLQVKVTPATKEGNVTLTCSTSCPLTDDTTYIWHQNGQRVTNEHNNVLHLGLTTEEVGYSCAVKGHEDLRSETITVRDEAVFPWVPVVTVGAVLTVAVLLVTIYCTMRRRSTGGSDATTDPQSVHPDAMGETQTAQNLTTLSPDYDTLGSVHPDTNSDTYSVLNMKTRSPDYDTLDSVHPDTNSNTYSSLNMKIRSPDYDTLDCVRDSHNDNDGQKNLDYENFGEPPQNLD